MALIYVTLDQDDKFRAYKTPPAGKTALIVNVAHGLLGLTEIIVAHDLGGYDVFANASPTEVIDWADKRSAVNINLIELVN